MNLIEKHNAGIFLYPKHIFIALLLYTLVLLQIPMLDFYKSQ